MFEGLLQPTHLILILLIVLIVFGPGKLPEIGGSLGKSFSEFRRSLSAGSDSGDSCRPAEPASRSRVCSSCNSENPPSNSFCGRCGARLS